MFTSDGLFVIAKDGLCVAKACDVETAARIAKALSREAAYDADDEYRKQLQAARQSSPWERGECS